MPRVKRGVTARARHKKVLALAKGFRGRRKSSVASHASPTILKSKKPAAVRRRERTKDRKRPRIPMFLCANKKCALRFATTRGA